MRGRRIERAFSTGSTRGVWKTGTSSGEEDREEADEVEVKEKREEAEEAALAEATETESKQDMRLAVVSGKG